MYILYGVAVQHQFATYSLYSSGHSTAVPGHSPCRTRTDQRQRLQNSSLFHLKAKTSIHRRGSLCFSHVVEYWVACNFPRVYPLFRLLFRLTDTQYKSTEPCTEASTSDHGRPDGGYWYLCWLQKFHNLLFFLQLYVCLSRYSTGEVLQPYCLVYIILVKAQANNRGYIYC